ncbi:hypothetical protein [Methylosinus sp. PW1]|uniref:hypothetical protein n=1 Tax=Methylosinus sp. PW1 TaxID=107636 RepID=UPI0005604B28|nr:hypothetical protein [Methylosinus sp. PW1]
MNVASNPTTRQYHDDVLEDYERPKWLVASKPNSESDQTFEGDAADLRHDYWILRTADPAKVRDSDFKLDFRQPVSEEMLLTDESRVNDLLTAKILVIETMRGQYLRPARTAKRTVKMVFTFAWIVRWRLALNVTEMSKLSPALFDDFCDRLASGGLPDLIDLESRLARLEKRYREGEYDWPRYRDGSNILVDFGKIGRTLGVPFQILNATNRKRIRNLAEGGGSLPETEIVDDANNDNEQNDKGTLIAYERALEFFTVWDLLHLSSNIGLISHDQLEFNPFEKTSIDARARQVGRTLNLQAGEGRTGTLESENWLRLLDGAARWVLDYSKPILDSCKLIADCQSEIFSQKHERRSQKNIFTLVTKALTEDYTFNGRRLSPTWRRHNKAFDPDDITLEEALAHLITACLVLIGGFSARRHGELNSLQAGCVYKDQVSGAWILSSYIEKTIRDNAEIPVPAAVAVAVQILERLSESARLKDKTNWLTKVHRPSLSESELNTGQRIYIQTMLQFTLNSFADIVGARTSSDGTLWKFKPHQLRRAFAIYYYHHNRYSNLDAISRFLRHFDPEMTRRYITETIPGAHMRMREIVEARSAKAQENERISAEARDAMRRMKEVAVEYEDVRQEYFVERNMQIYDNDESPIGRGAALLMDELEDLVAQARNNITIGSRMNCSPDRERTALLDLLRSRAPERYLEPHPGRHAHCACRPDVPEDTADAICLQMQAKVTGAADTRANYAFSGPKECYDCKHCVAFAENVIVMKRKIEEAEQATKSPAERFRVAAQSRLDAYKATLESARAAVRDRGR